MVKKENARERGIQKDRSRKHSTVALQAQMLLIVRNNFRKHQTQSHFKTHLNCVGAFVTCYPAFLFLLEGKKTERFVLDAST